jgi:serine/threonine protein kinase
MVEQAKSPGADIAPGLLEVGVELKYINGDQAETARKRQQELRMGGVNLPIGQVLLERRFLGPSELKKLMRELEYRREHSLKANPPRTKTQINKKFGHYELLQVLSESGRCRVFKARDESMGRIVVLKILPQQFASNAHWYERFRREVQLAGKLTHPNIVTAYGASEIDGNPSLALEFVDGVSLGDRLDNEGNLPERTAWLIGREIAKALQYAAANNILHRDIKPDNIICGKDGKIKLCDMGLARSMEDDTSLTAAGTTVGTPFYISPEQARSTKDLDGRADIYSLGCTIFHMLTGSVPFMGEGLTDVMRAHVSAARPDPRELLPEISEASAKLVMRMMAIEPKDRPDNATVLIDEIDALLPSVPEAEATVRPLTKVAPTETSELEHKSTQHVKVPGIKAAPKGEKTPQPSAITRALDWFMNLFN